MPEFRSTEILFGGKAGVFLRWVVIPEMKSREERMASNGIVIAKA